MNLLNLFMQMWVMEQVEEDDSFNAYVMLVTLKHEKNSFKAEKEKAI